MDMDWNPPVLFDCRQTNTRFCHVHSLFANAQVLISRMNPFYRLSIPLGFESEFCTSGRGNEKGGAEGEGDYFRRNHLVPIPRARDIEGLNRQLLEGSREDKARVLNGRSESVGEAMNTEREYLLPLAREGFQIAEVRFPQVNAKGTVKVLTNFYSVPVAVGVEVCAKGISGPCGDLASGPVRRPS